MKCPKCGKQNRDGALRCAACGKLLPRRRPPARPRRWVLPVAIGGGLALVAAVVVVTVLLSSGQAPGPQRSQQRIAYIDNVGNVAVAYDNGAGARLLTSWASGMEYKLPRWSPDRRWLAATFLDQSTRLYSLWLAGAEDEAGRLIPLGVKASPLSEWAPDSRHIAVAGTDQAGAWQLILVDTAGGSRAIALSMTAQQIAWSPDGRQIALIGQVGDLATGSSHILVVDVEQGQARSVAVGTVVKFWTVDWTPDGQRLVVTQADATGGSAGLVSLRPDGSDAQRMNLYGSEGASGWPLYSPDGERMAYEAIDMGTGQYSLVVARADGSEARVVVTAGNHVYPTEWSADGTYLLYYERSTQTQRVYDTGSGQSSALAGEGDRHYTGCVFAPDVPALACASEQKIVYLIYLDEGRVQGLAYGDSPDW